MNGPESPRSTHRNIEEVAVAVRGVLDARSRVEPEWTGYISSSAQHPEAAKTAVLVSEVNRYHLAVPRHGLRTPKSELVRYRREHGTSGENSVHDEKRQARILVVEDEVKVARALQEGLERQHYDVVIAPTGEEGFFLVNAEEFGLVILDLMLPGRDGLQVLSTLRKRGLHTPVLILTARDAIEDRVQGLDKGADDYLVKPFAFPELLARVRALLRRTEHAVQLRLADLEMDVVTRKARRR